MDSRIGKRVIGPAILSSFVVISAVLIATYPINHALAYPYGIDAGEYRFGTISSIQNDKNGDPAWVLSGHWKGNLMSNNQTLVEGRGNESFGGGSINTQFEMVRLNGSAGHTHTITNFVGSNYSQINNSTVSLILGTTLYTTITVLGQEQYSFVTQWGTSGTGYGTFKQPLEIAVDKDDNVYVTDFTSVSNKVQKFTTNGTFLTSWGTLGFGTALFTSPSGIGISSSGNVYVADFGSPETAVQELTNEGTFLRM